MIWNGTGMREASKVLGDVKNAMKAAEEAEQRGDADDVIHPPFSLRSMISSRDHIFISEHLEKTWFSPTILKSPEFGPPDIYLTE